MAGPLEGIRVLDWTQYQQGTFATVMLADLGASVIHIEDREYGDAGRGVRVRSLLSDEELEAIKTSIFGLPHGKSWYFECFNRGKQSLTLDLTKEKGKEVIYRLVKNSDVFVHNYRQGVPERLKLDYETLCQYNPRLIYAAASGYGPKGPEANEPAFDVLGIARSGIMNMVGEPDMPPLWIELGIADQLGGIMTGYGILTALLVREWRGIGQKVDASLLGSMITLQGYTIGQHLYLEREAVRPSRKQATNPLWNYYPCQDGQWLMLAMSQSDRYWPTVCQALGIGHLENDPRFADPQNRFVNCAELIAILDEIFIARSPAEWMKILKEAGDVICTPIQSINDLANDPQILANNYIIDRHHDVLGPVKVVGLPIQLSKTPGEVNCTAPELGQHTEEVLIDVGGYTWEEIAQLREEEVI